MMSKQQLSAARHQVAGIVDAIEAGELDATDAQLAHLCGSLSALDAMLAPSPLRSRPGNPPNG